MPTVQPTPGDAALGLDTALSQLSFQDNVEAEAPLVAAQFGLHPNYELYLRNKLQVRPLGWGRGAGAGAGGAGLGLLMPAS